MVFIIRQPGVEDIHNVHDAATASGVTDAVVCQAGIVVMISGDQKVAPVTSGSQPYGFLLQKVKNQYDTFGLPQGFRYAGDLGSSDAFVGDAVGVFVSGGIADTDQYAADSTGAIVAGSFLYAKDGGVLTDDSSLSVIADTPVAVAKNSLSANAITNGKYLRIKSLL